MVHARDGIELRVMVKWPIKRQRPQQQARHECVPLIIILRNCIRLYVLIQRKRYRELYDQCYPGYDINQYLSSFKLFPAALSGVEWSPVTGPVWPRGFQEV